MADTVIFSEAEARAFDKGQLRNPQQFTSAAIVAKEVAIRERFERIIGVRLIAAANTEWCSGLGDNILYLPHHNPWAAPTPSPVTLTSVHYLDSDDAPTGGTAFTVAELADIVAYPDKIVRRSGRFVSGYRNYKVVYTTGYTTVPKDIKDAALWACVQELVPTSLPSSVIDGETGSINWSRVRDSSRGRWYGNEAIDSVLREHRDIEIGIGVA